MRQTAGMSAPHRQHEIVVLARYKGGSIRVFRSFMFFSLAERTRQREARFMADPLHAVSARSYLNSDTK
jgi:hypothetical protein